MERREHKIRHANVIIGVATGSLWLLIAMGIASLTTGCAGMEVGGKAGIYRVDERSDSSATKNDKIRPLVCYFKNCDDLSEVRGS